MRTELFLGFVGLTLAAGADVVDLFVLAGQSQAVNFDNDADNLPASLQSPQSDVRFRYTQGWWPDNDTGLTAGVATSGGWTTLRPQASGSADVYNPGRNIDTGFGPELTLGRDLAAGISGREVGIVKYAWNSTSLGSRADREGWNVNDSGQLYVGLLSEVADAVTDLENQGHTVAIRGFFWQQGEGDHHDPALYNAYEQNLNDLVGTLRTAWNPNLVAVIPRLSTAQTSASGWPEDTTGFNTVRAAQENVGEAGSLNAWIDTDDLSVVNGTIHFDEASTQLIGERMAETYFATVPEPGTLGLVLLSLSAFFGLIWKRITPFGF